MRMQDRSSGVPEWDQQFLEALGKLVVEWGQLEMLLHQTCWTAAGLTEDQGRAASSGQNWRSEWQFLQTEVAQRFPHLQKDTAGFGQRLAQVAVQRQRIMHGMWMPGDPAGERLLIQRSADRRGQRALSMRELVMLALELSAAREALAELNMRMHSGGDGGGGAGVREPRRPYPSGDQDALSLPE